MNNNEWYGVAILNKNCNKYHIVHVKNALQFDDMSKLCGTKLAKGSRLYGDTWYQDERRAIATLFEKGSWACKKCIAIIANKINE